MESSQKEKRVYITNSSASVLKDAYAQLTIAVTSELKNGLYKENLSWILSDVEFKYLFIEQLIFDKNPLFTLDPTSIQKKDTGYVFFSNTPPKYHFNVECLYLKSNYLNLEIPPEIKDRGSEMINKFREFAEENKSIFTEDQERFITMLEARFLLKNRPAEINFMNSGRSGFVALSIEGMEERIDSHLSKAKEFMDANPTIKKLNYASATKIKNRPNINPLDEKWHSEYKKELKSMLRYYLRKKADPELSYSKSFLDSLGFEGCKACGGELDLT